MEHLDTYRRLWMVCPDPVPPEWERLIREFGGDLLVRGYTIDALVEAGTEGIRQSRRVREVA